MPSMVDVALKCLANGAPCRYHFQDLLRSRPQGSPSHANSRTPLKAIPCGFPRIYQSCLDISDFAVRQEPSPHLSRPESHSCQDPTSCSLVCAARYCLPWSASLTVRRHPRRCFSLECLVEVLRNLFAPVFPRHCARASKHVYAPHCRLWPPRSSRILSTQIIKKTSLPSFSLSMQGFQSVLLGLECSSITLRRLRQWMVYTIASPS
ncbi:hypothetical protein R3P38DRAFT_3016 [Favolaschia claudopus]|uniref:Uncharacterized protein n=1 Tax=Favolaschia claudopus TaxID=2862362 RepID=A0AAW0EFW4_9AGAR